MKFLRGAPSTHRAFRKRMSRCMEEHRSTEFTLLPCSSSPSNRLPRPFKNQRVHTVALFPRISRFLLQPPFFFPPRWPLHIYPFFITDACDPALLSIGIETEASGPPFLTTRGSPGSQQAPSSNLYTRVRRRTLGRPLPSIQPGTDEATKPTDAIMVPREPNNPSRSFFCPVSPFLSPVRDL